MKSDYGNSLAVQWLGHCVFTAEGGFGSLVVELRSYKPRSTAKEGPRVLHLFSRRALSASM